MKRLIIISTSIIIFVLSSCIVQNDGLGPLYDKLVGEWLVYLDTRPEGWPDTKYVFGSDQTFEIYYDTDLVYTGVVILVNNQSIYVTPPVDPGKEYMVMCYILSNGDTTMKLGWYPNGTPECYLDLTKQ